MLTIMFETGCTKGKGTKVCLFENGCESGLFTVSYHFLHHLYDDLERLSTLLFSDAAPYEHLNVVRKNGYSRISMSIASRMPETSSASKMIVDGLIMNEIGIFVTSLPPVKGKLVLPLLEAGCSLSRNALQIKLNIFEE